MKKVFIYRLTLLSFFVFFHFLSAKAQIIPLYAFSQSTNSQYDTLNAPQVIASGANLDNQTYPLTLPFAFNFNNTNYNSIYVSVNGFISFGTTDPGGSYYMISSNFSGFELFSGFDANLGGRGDSTKLSYQTVGIAPNRTFIIEWKNFGFSANPALLANFQISLSETTGIISVQYGRVALTGSSNNLSVQVGLRGMSNGTYNNRSSLNSNWLNTTSGTVATGNIVYQSNQNPPIGLKYTFTPPATCTAPSQPTGLNIYPSLTNVSISFTASSPAPSGYLLVRTNDSVPLNTIPQNGVSYNAGDQLGNGTVVYKGSSSNLGNSGLTQNTSYTYTLFPYNSTNCYYAPTYNTVNPLSASIETLGPRTYYWNATAANADFQVAGNWTPGRTHTDAQDTLIFNNGATTAISNVPATLNVNKLVIGNNSSISFSSNNIATITTKALLQIDAGSTLTLGGGYVLKLAFNNTGLATAHINGTLNLAGSGFYDARYANTLVTGTVSVTGANAEFNTTCTSGCNTQFLFGPNAKYYHNRNGGKLPSASFDPGATVFVTGTTTVSPTMTVLPSQNQMLGNLVVDCPNATINMNLISTLFNFNNVTLKNPGSGIFTLTANSVINGNLYLQKGTLSATTLTVLGDAVIDSGTVNTGTYLLSGALNILPMATFKAGFSLIGNTHQTVTVNGTFFSNFSTTITLNNPSGATLTGMIPINDGKVVVTSGKWDGTGRFTYSGNTSLRYNGALSLYTSPVEWPTSGGMPSKVILAQTGVSPNNRVYLQESHTIPQAFNLYSGILVLGAYDVNYIDDVYFFETYTNSKSFLATNGTGKINMNFPSGQQTNIFPLGDIDGTDESTPVRLSFNNTATTVRLIGAGVKNAKYPNITDTVNCISRYWSFTDNGNVPVNYNIQLACKFADKQGNLLSLLQKWDGTTWTNYPTNAAVGDTLFTLNNQNSAGLNGTTFTAFALNQTASQVYTWNGAMNNDYQVAANWTPARSNPANTDILVFNNSQVDTVVNVPTQMIARLSILNNTTVNFAGSTANIINELGIISDLDSATNEFSIEQGSKLRFLAGNYIRVRFFTNGSTVYIAGALDLFRTGIVDFTNTKSIVTATGILGSGDNMNSSISDTKPIYSTKANLEIRGAYNNNYFGEGYVPLATWADGSNVYILNNKTTQAATVLNQPDGFGQKFYNVIYNCPNQQSSVTWTSSVMPDSIRGTFTIISTGTSSLRVGGINETSSIFINKFKMSNGNILFGCHVNIPDSLINAGGIVRFINDKRNLNFIGTAGRQYAEFVNTAPTGWVTYNILNPDGIYLVGTGNFNTNPNFDLGSSSGVKIGTPVLFPILTNLKLTYGTSSSCRLEYNGAAYMADSVVFPAVNGPAHVTINLDNSSGVVTVPFSRTIRSYLYLTKGDIDFGANSLTVGISAADNFETYGQISGPGRIRLTTGTLTRWINTTIGPISTLMKNFPIAYGPKDRTAVLNYGSTSGTTVPTGGTITISHAHVPGMLTGLNINDGTFNISNRFNSAWKLTPGNGLVMNSNISLTLFCEGIGTVNTPANLRVMWPTTTIGTHATTTAFMGAVRSGLTLSTLTDSAFYIGTDSATANIDSTLFISVNSGNWNNPATWNLNMVPTANSSAFITQGDTVTVQLDNTVNNLTVNSGGALSSIAGNMQVRNNIANSGAFMIDGGNVQLGLSNGVNTKTFTNPGSFYMYGGSLKVYGSFSANGSGFYQSGGNIIIDGIGVNSSSSVSGTIVSIATTNVNATGGTLQIVDPQNSTTNTFTGGGFSQNHTLIFGDSVSTTVNSGSNLGFNISTNGKAVGNLVVNSTPNIATGRLVKLNSGVTILGNLQLSHANATLDLNSNTVTIKGNISLDSNTQVIASRFIFSDINNTVNTTPQSVSGKGKFVPLGDINFQSITVNNSSATGVTFDIGDFIAKDITLTKGVLNMSGGILTQAPNSTLVQGGGWVNGKFRTYLKPTLNTRTNFPVGTAQFAKSVVLSNLQVNSIVNPGYITVSVLDGDHSNIGSSVINANKTVNNHYIIDSTNSEGLILGTGNFTAALKYTTNDIDPNADAALFTLARYQNNNWLYFTPGSVNLDSISATLPGNKLIGSYQVGQSDSLPVITQHPQSTQICTGLNAQFSISANANAYTWQVNTGGSWTDISNGSIYTGASSGVLLLNQPPVTMNGYLYRCIAYNFKDSVISNAATLTIGGTVTPTITIAATTGSAICAGQPATFNATITNGGNLPQYQWKVNGVVVGNSSSTYTSGTLTNNDTVSCTLTSALNCASPAAINSNTIVMTVTTPTPVSVTISGSALNNTVCYGTPVTFTATTTNGGSNPVYQWRRNGINTGTNSAVFQTNSLSNGDLVRCIVTGSDCSASSSDTSNVIPMTVIPVADPSISISASSTTICPAQNITFTATGYNGGTAPVYQWKINGSNAGTNAATFTSTGINNGDIITCALTSNAPCTSNNTANSNALTITVSSAVTPAITITAGNNNSCSGSTITFTTAIVNGGNSPAYQWKVNGANVGSNSNTYASATLNNSDMVTCVLTSNASCAVVSSVTSNAIGVVTTPLQTPTVAISADAVSSCAGSTVTFTATATLTGSTPVYQWKVNNINVGTNSSTYSSATLNNSDVVKCVMTSNATGCLTSNQATSNDVTVTVNSYTTPAINITASGNNTCQGAPVTFTAAITHGGTTPAYQWYVNNVPAGTNANTYTSTALNNGDQVKCKLVSNLNCVTTPEAQSNSITMAVLPMVTPTIAITNSGSDTICQGTGLSFAAAVTNEGSNPIYQWKINNVPAGSNTPTFATTTLNNSDIVSCTLTSNAACTSGSAINSNTISITVNPVVAPTININAVPGNEICAGVNVTFTASITGGGDVPVYQWTKNGVTVGSNTNAYSDNALNDNDQVACSLVSNAPCAGTTPVLSNVIDMSVAPNVTPAVSITAAPGTSITQGTPVTFTANVINGGSSPTYNWKKNGAGIPGNNTATYQSSSLNNGDVISVQVTSNALCAAVSEVTSNTLTMQVNTLGIHKLPEHIRSLQLYPNPTKSDVTIKGIRSTSKEEAVVIELQTMLGQSLTQEQVHINKSEFEYKLQIPASIASGTYLIRLKFEEGIYVQKIVIER